MSDWLRRRPVVSGHAMARLRELLPRINPRRAHAMIAAMWHRSIDEGRRLVECDDGGVRVDATAWLRDRDYDLVLAAHRGTRFADGRPVIATVMSVEQARSQDKAWWSRHRAKEDGK